MPSRSSEEDSLVVRIVRRKDSRPVHGHPPDPLPLVSVPSALEEQARYWGRAPEATAELEELLARYDVATPEGGVALHDALGAFVATHAVFTETEMQAGLHDLRVDGDEAVAYRIGHNPGGEFREEVRFVRLDGRWFMRGPAR